MQEEVEQKTFNIVVSTTKLTARTILNAGKAAIQQQQAKMAGGKQSVRMLLWGDRIFEKCGIGRDERGDGGKTLEIRGKRRLPARDGGANYQQS